MPRLWCSIKFGPDLRDSDRKLMRMSLSRSGCLPLSLEFEKILNTPRNKSANLTQFAKLILPHSSRLEAFSLPAQIIGQFSPAEHSFDLLKKIEFFEHNRTPLNAYSSPNNFASAPQLCCVRFEGIFAPSLVKLPWLQLTECEVTGSSFYEILRFLARTINIDQASLRVKPDGGVHSFPPNIIRLPHLRSLHLATTEHQAPHTILDALILPELNSLSIRVSLPAPEQLCSLLMQSSCSLRRLVLSCWGTATKALIWCLESVPLLAELELGGLVFNSSDKECECLNQLQRTSGNAKRHCLVPRLEVLTLRFAISLFTRPDFTDMIESPGWNVGDASKDDVGVRLHVVRLTVYGTPDGIPTLSRLRRMQNEGLDITISYHQNSSL